MGACSFQTKFIVQELVDQYPVRLNVTIAVPVPVASKLVIAVPGRQGFPGKKKVYNDFEFCQILPSLLYPFDILLELMGLGKSYLSQES